MKNMKKFFAFLLAMAMVMGMATSAFAYNISVKKSTTSGEVTGHEYKVYQLYTGDLATVNGTNVLSNLKYGSAGLGETGTDVPESEVAAITDAEEYAQSLIARTDIELKLYGTLDFTNNWKITGAPAGYYLIVDDTEQKLSDGDTYSKYIVQVVDDVEMAPKSETVTSDKKEYNDAKNQTAVNEAGVGAVVSYELTAKIPADATVYDTYYFILGDKLSDGLTFNDDIVVTIGGNEANKDTDYAVYKNEDGYTFQVALLDAKEHAGQEVKVQYSATVNSAAVTSKPEENTFEVIYSNNPYEDYDGMKKPTDENYKPGKPITDKDDAFGKTPEKKTETYTCEIDITKRADTEQGNLLAGAQFELKSINANQTVLAAHEYYGVDENGTYYKLKDGTYTTTAPTYDRYEENGTGDENTTEGYILVNGKYVVPTNTADYNGKTLYKFVEGNSGLYADVTTKYAKKTENTLESVASPVDIILTTGSDGKIKFEDLGTGTYTLTELVAPDGYNLAAPVTYIVTFDENTKKFTVTKQGSAQGTVLENGVYDDTVIDKSGTVLPETGGMGTRLFYMIGGLLVVAAGVLLITKRRMATK